MRKTRKTTPKYALLSVFDKEGIVRLAKILVELGYEIISTGGTAKILLDNQIPVIPTPKITGNPECFDGRMKTISFQIEGGILFDRQNPAHVREAKKLGVLPIEVVVCNLYPFEKVIGSSKANLKAALENIDVGGPTMLRAAAKNFQNVLVICEPQDYPQVALSLRKGEINLHFRQNLAAKAFSHLSFYDAQIARFLNKYNPFPYEITLPGRKITNLRYGENPHQKAAFYLEPNAKSPLASLRQLWGRQLSLVNLTDINAGLESIHFFSEPAAVVIKHNTPCGIALGKSAQEALKRAIEADPESAFGGVIVLNRRMDLATAKIVAQFKGERKGNIDIIAIPQIDGKALKLLKTVRKSMGIYTFGHLSKRPFQQFNLKWVDGGFILQTLDNHKKGLKSWSVVTRRRPTRKQLEQMKIAWLFLRRIRSNAVIVVDRNLPITRGVGSGQTSRVRSTKLALEQAGKYTQGAILASDSFFPFPDSVELAAKYGIGAIVQQGDSINDSAAIEAANQAGVPMVFTHRRAFWH